MWVRGQRRKRYGSNMSSNAYAHAAEHVFHFLLANSLAINNKTFWKTKLKPLSYSTLILVLVTSGDFCSVKVLILSIMSSIIGHVSKHNRSCEQAYDQE